jgi:hypothetical protein
VDERGLFGRERPAADPTPEVTERGFFDLGFGLHLVTYAHNL